MPVGVWNNLGESTKKESAKRLSDKWTEKLYRVYLYCIKIFFATVLNIFLKEIISFNTECGKNVFDIQIKLESTG